MPQDHARIAPSSMGALEKCSKFKYKQRDDGSDEEGTLLHEAAETHDLKYLDEEQTRAVTMALDYTASLKASLGEGAQEFHERRVHLKEINFGTADCILINADNTRAAVIDYKFVRNSVMPADGNVSGAELSEDEAMELALRNGNLQIGNYCLALLDEIPSLKSCEGIIVSPRTQEISRAVYLREHMDVLKDRIVRVVERYNNPFDPPHPGTYCEQCERISQCPAIQKSLVPTGKLLFGAARLTKLFGPVAEMTPEELAYCKALLSLMAAWSEQRKDEINERTFREHLDVPFYTKITKSGATRLKKESLPEALRYIVDQQIAGTDQVFKCVGSLSLSSLAKELGVSREELDTRLQAFVERSQDSQYLQKRRGLDERLLLTQGIQEVPSLRDEKEGVSAK